MKVPDRELAPASQWEGLYRVTTTDDQFTTRRFSVTDSTLVISKLGGSDKHYARIKLPVVIALADVRSVERLESHDGHTALAIAGVLVVGAIIYLVWAVSNIEMGY